MSAQRASAPVRFARLAAAALLIALAAVVIVRLAGRPRRASCFLTRAAPARRPDRRPQGAGPAPGISGTAGLSPTSAARASSSAPTGGTISRAPSRSRISARRARPSRGFRPTRSSTIPARFASPSPGMSASRRAASSSKGTRSTTTRRTAPSARRPAGRFSSKTMTGRAGEVLYAEGADEVRLARGVRVELSGAGRPGETVVLTGDSFTYARKARRGMAAGRAQFSAGRARGEAKSITITAAQDEKRLESANFDGAVRIVLAGGAPGGPGTGRGPRGPHPGGLRPGDRAHRFDRGRGKYGTLPAVRREPDDRRQGAEGRTWRSSPTGGLRSWAASGGIRAELADAGGPSRTIDGESAAFDAATGSLRALGAPGHPAVADSPDARVEAASMTGGPRRAVTSKLRAASSAFSRRGRDAGTAGFFSSGEDVSVSGDSLVLRAGASSASFTGNVRAWQGTELLRARELEFAEERGEMRGRGVVAVVPAQAGTGAASGRTIELGGEAMVYSAASRTLALTGKSYVQLPEARLEAGAIAAVLGGGGNAVESLVGDDGGRPSPRTAMWAERRPRPIRRRPGG